jgi:hypothetical protein
VKLIIVHAKVTIMFIERICIATDGSDLAVRAAQMGVLLAHTGAGCVVGGIRGSTTLLDAGQRCGHA